MPPDREPRDLDQTQSFIVIQPGAMVSHYKIVKQIGIGGMGEVYEAYDTKLNRNIALKFLSSNFASDANFRDRFLREARSAAVLNHPNIITIFEVAEFQDQIYIAMEYVEGKTIRELIDQGSSSLEYIYDLSIQICDGLAEAHSNNMIHRDIKPLNILVDKNNRVRILDFGLAKGEDDANLTQAGTAMGTVNYMSPEQGQGADLDKRSDIFSFGIVLYEMITGQLPFKTGNIAATIYSIVHDQPKKLKEYNSAFPDELQRIVDKVLQKDPNNRYQDIHDMKNDIINLKFGTQLKTQVINAYREPSVEIPAEEMKSLAVLYLRNLGTEKDEYLSYGITEDLIIDLSRIGSIRVPPMRSVMRYKDSTDDLEQIGKKLNVNYILDGSIHKFGDKIRLSVQLVDIKKDDTIWADRWEEPIDNLPHIKDSLAENIGFNLNIGQTVIAKAQVAQPKAKDAGAYENYLKGKFHFEQKHDKSDVEIALGLYRQALREEPSLIAAKTGIAEIKMYNGEFTEAKIELEAALSEADARDMVAEKINILKLMANYHVKKSQWDKALEKCEEALVLVKNQGDLAGEAEILGIVISILQPQAEYDRIFIHFDRVLEISRKLDDQEKIGTAMKNMGIVYSRKGDYDQAEQLYNEAMGIAKEQENDPLIAACLSNMGNIFYFRGDYEKAYQHYKQASEMAERLGDKALSARQNINMGLIEFHRSNFDAGLVLLKKSTDAFRELGDRSNVAITLVNISQAYLTLGEVEKAINSAQDALDIAREINHPLAEADALFRIGAANMYISSYDEAISKFTEALKIAEDSSNHRNIALGNLFLTRTYFRMNDLPQCRKFAKKSHSVAKEIGEKTIMLNASSFLGAVTVLDGLYSTGLKQIEDAIKELEKSGHVESIVQSKILLGYILSKHSKTEPDIDEGKNILNDTLKIARENKFVPEINLIERIIGSLG